MVRITRVHTGGGDGGETSLLTGERVAKSIDRVELFGTIDELNSSIGCVRMELSRLPILNQNCHFSNKNCSMLVASVLEIQKLSLMEWF